MHRHESSPIGRMWCVGLLMFVHLISLGCQGLPSITGPGTGRHRITVGELALSDSDFTKSALGAPKDIELLAFKDGAEVKIGKMDGFRGPKNPDLSFELDYDPQSRYEFKIQEVSVLTQGKTWNFSSSQPGNWIFDGRKTFGSGSSITFRDEKVR